MSKDIVLLWLAQHPVLASFLAGFLGGLVGTGIFLLINWLRRYRATREGVPTVQAVRDMIRRPFDELAARITENHEFISTVDREHTGALANHASAIRSLQNRPRPQPAPRKATTRKGRGRGKKGQESKDVWDHILEDDLSERKDTPTG